MSKTNLIKRSTSSLQQVISGETTLNSSATKAEIDYLEYYTNKLNQSFQLGELESVYFEEGERSIIFKKNENGWIVHPSSVEFFDQLK
jgi:hypothetical protein